MFKMYNGATMINCSHIPLSDQGGRGSVVSFSSNPPTVSEPPVVKTKRFRRGDVNPSDGTIFWCYERSKRAGGSVYIRERWMTPQKYTAEREWKKLRDAQYMRGQAYRAGADKRAQATKRWKQSERGRERTKISRQRPEVKERRRAYSKEYGQRPEVAERRKIADQERYQRLKQDPQWVAKSRASARKWQASNKKKYRESLAQWQQKYGKAYRNNRYRTDPQFALGVRVRSRVWAALKRGGASKTGRTEELVGCSFDFLRQHIERQFNGKMSWDKPGSFHIDHIIPLAAFDLTDPAQLKVACNWQNMRPLSPRKNMSKGAKLLHPQQQLPLSVHSTTFNTQAV
jgi:hypothetical protein